MGYHRPSYMTRLPRTVKDLLLDMQIKAKQLKWSVVGNTKDVTLTLTWQYRKKVDKVKKANHSNTSKCGPTAAAYEESTLSDLVADNETSPTPCTLLEHFQTEQTQRTNASETNTTEKPYIETVINEVDDGYLTEKATPDELHVYPTVVVQSPQHLVPKDNFIARPDSPSNNDENLQVSPNIGPNNMQRGAGSETTGQEIGDSEENFVDLMRPAGACENEPGLYLWQNDPLNSQDDGHLQNSSEKLLSQTSICPENDVSIQAIRFGKYVKFRESDSEFYQGDNSCSVHEFSEQSDVYDGYDEWDNLIKVRQLENSPRHRISYIRADSVDNLDKTKKAKRKNSIKKLFSPWRKKKLSEAKKSSKGGQKIISPKPLYSHKTYIQSPKANGDNGYERVIQYQKIKTNKNNANCVYMKPCDSPSLEANPIEINSDDLVKSVDHCLRSCDTILSRHTHAPSEL